MDCISEIVALEWEMFQAVNAGGPRASCQNDPVTFDGMRRGQFLSWSQAALESYRQDLLAARAAGRNLLKEKYIRMMEHTDPEGYAKLSATIPVPSEAQRALAAEINGKLIDQTQVLFAKYPHVAGAGRPLHSSEDSQWATSVETYQLGELLTYSQATLEALKAHLLALEGEGVSLAERILENSVKHYGYQSLEQAEQRTAQHAKDPFYGVTVESGGCGCCGG